MFVLIFICLIIGFFSNSSDYINEEAIEYARKYCKDRNNNYAYLSNSENEKVNFVSQCLFEGGQSFSGCRGKDIYGILGTYNDLTDCLQKKGWKISATKNDKIKEGYPAFEKGKRNFLIITDFKDNKVIYCAHKGLCNKEIDENNLIYLKPHHKLPCPFFC